MSTLPLQLQPFHDSRRKWKAWLSRGSGSPVAASASTSSTVTAAEGGGEGEGDSRVTLVSFSAVGVAATATAVAAGMASMEESLAGAGMAAPSSCMVGREKSGARSSSGTGREKSKEDVKTASFSRPVWASTWPVMRAIWTLRSPRSTCCSTSLVQRRAHCGTFTLPIMGLAETASSSTSITIEQRASASSTENMKVPLPWPGW
mmetsp:Transcript_15107/g.59145  ORF Transcript_15107/g.59145 Transcript_15107/m.59145 type:complete len:204 (+) Transcript_15107:806-1417(+)